MASFEIRSTMNPQDAPLQYVTGAPRVLSEDEWKLLANDVYQGVLSALTQREPFEQNWKAWLQLYEMDSGREPGSKNTPWEGASDVILPIIPEKLDTMVAQIAAMALPPRLVIVTGRTPKARESAHVVEQYYNAQLKIQRGTTTWFDELLKFLQLSFVFGTAFVYCPWRKTERKSRIREAKPMLDDQGGPVFGDDGKPKMQFEEKDISETLYDDVDVRARDLHDFLLVPPTAASVDDAVAVYHAEWFYESDLNELVKDGALDADEVERALTYVPQGNDDVASNIQGFDDKDSGGQVMPGQGQGAQTSKFFKNRGPIKVWVGHTRQYDLNGDGEPEENIVFLHEQSQALLGWTTFDYMIPGDKGPARPVFTFCPMPRPTDLMGFSLPERLAGIAAEIFQVHNSRNNAIDLATGPPLLRLAGTEDDTNNKSWSPFAIWDVAQLDAIKVMEFPSPPLASSQEEGLLNQYADRFTGINQPASGAQAPGRRTATEMKQQAAGNSTRANLIALMFRITLRQFINYVHRLKIQYQGDTQFVADGATFVLPRDVLTQDYQIDIVGASDPIDMDTRRNEAMGFTQVMMQMFPFIQQDEMKQWHLARMLAEAFNVPDIDSIVGTKDEANQRAQQKAQAMQMQQQMAMQQQQGQQAQQAAQTQQVSAQAQKTQAEGQAAQHESTGAAAGAGGEIMDLLKGLMGGPK